MSLKPICAALAVSVLAAVAACGQPTNASWRQESPVRVHDPSTIVRSGGEFWMFSTGPGIKAFRSTNLFDWQPAGSVMRQMPGWVRGVVPDHSGSCWAPDVVRVGKRWLLYYSVSSFGKNVSAIGLASNPTLDPKDPTFQWTDEGVVIRSHQTNDFNTIDPAVTYDAEGKLWLAFGSYWSGIKLVQLDAQTGQRIAPEAPLHSLAWNDNIEAAFIHRRGTNYFLFLNWGQCCKGTNSTYEIRVGRSDRITGPYLDRGRKDLVGAGGTLVLGSEGRFIGPGHAGIFHDGVQEWFSFHYYAGDDLGRPKLGIRRLRWDETGWPVVEKSD